MVKSIILLDAKDVLQARLTARREFTELLVARGFPALSAELAEKWWPGTTVGEKINAQRTPSL